MRAISASFYMALAVILTLLPFASAQRTGLTRGQTFMGCNSLWPPIEGATRWSVSASTVYNNGLDCANSCASTSGGGSISYWSTSARTCKCSQTYPTTTDYSFGVPGTCPSNTNELYRMQTTFTAYQAYYCRATSDLTLTYSASGSNINACFQQCKSFTYAIWVPRGSNVFECACSNNAAASGLNSLSVTCNSGTAFVYVHSAQAQASLLDRRRRRLEAQNVVAAGLCPAGLTACRIQDSTEGFECIDTLSELESCGGCIHGSVESSNLTTPAVDCTTLGASLGSATCLNGRCVVSGCGKGRSLQHGVCQ